MKTDIVSIYNNLKEYLLSEKVLSSFDYISKINNINTKIWIETSLLEAYQIITIINKYLKILDKESIILEVGAGMGIALPVLKKQGFLFMPLSL